VLSITHEQSVLWKAAVVVKTNTILATPFMTIATYRTFFQVDTCFQIDTYSFLHIITFPLHPSKKKRNYTNQLKRHQKDT